MRIELIIFKFFLKKIEEMKTVIEELRIEIRFNELASNLDITLIEGFKKSVLNVAEYISNGSNLRIKPIDSSFKINRIAYCFELPFE